MPASRQLLAVAGHRVRGHRDDRQVRSGRLGRFDARATCAWRCSRPAPASGNPSAPGRSCRRACASTPLRRWSAVSHSRPSTLSRRCATSRLTGLSSTSSTRACARASAGVVGWSCGLGARRRGLGARAGALRRAPRAVPHRAPWRGRSAIAPVAQFLRQSLRRHTGRPGARRRTRVRGRRCDAARSRCCACSPGRRAPRRRSTAGPASRPARRRSSASCVVSTVGDAQAPVRQQHAQARAQARVGGEQQHARAAEVGCAAPACRRAP